MSEFIAPTSRRAIEQAAKENLKVVFPNADELQLDIDDADALKVFEQNRDIVERWWGIASVVHVPSRSGKPGKLHITVRLNQKVSDVERIALQSFLGSDRKRELLSYIQAKNSDAHPTLFLEKQEMGELIPEDESETEKYKETFAVSAND